MTPTFKKRVSLCTILGLLPFALGGENQVSDQAAPPVQTAAISLPADSSAPAPATEPNDSAAATNRSAAVTHRDDVDEAVTNGKAPPPRLMSRITGLFDVELPRIDPPGTFKLIFHPHFGDLLHRGYIRTDVGVRWAVNDHFDINAEVDTYATHGLRSTKHGYGLGQVNGGFKYVIKQWPATDYQTSVGFNTAIPVDTPPIDMTDGLSHYTPNFVVQYRPPNHPRWTTFAGANIDFVSSTDVLGTPRINTPRDDSLSFTSGAIYDMGQLKWTVQATYTTTALIGDQSQNFYSVRPSVLWYVPKKYAFVSKTQWIIGVGANATWGPDGFHVNNSGRVRAEITFRQVMQKIRNATMRD